MGALLFFGVVVFDDFYQPTRWGHAKGPELPDLSQQQGESVRGFGRGSQPIAGRKPIGSQVASSQEARPFVVKSPSQGVHLLCIFIYCVRDS